jgi:hypothetical protein
VARTEKVVSFLVPGLAIAAIAAATLPLILHFLLRRPRATAWPSTMLLQRAMERLRRRRRLDGWILLALRVLGITLAGIAMAGPFFGTIGSMSGRRELWIVIDDGATAAEILPDGTPAIQAMQERLLQELSTLRPGDQAALVRASRPARVDIPPTLDHERIRSRIRDWSGAPVPSDLQTALELALPPDAESAPREILLASSLRRGSVPIDRTLPASWRDRSRAVRWRCVPATADPAPNRWIEGASIVRGSDLEERGSLRVDLRRRGDTGTEDDVQVRSTAGNVLAQSGFGWMPGASQTRKDVPLTGAAIDACTVQMRSDAQPLDDGISVVNAITAAPRVTIVGRRREGDDLDRLSASGWILQAMEAAGVQVRELDPSMLGIRPPTDADVVVITRPDLLDPAGWRWSSRHLRDGGLVVLMPVQGSDASWLLDLNRETDMRVEISSRDDGVVRKFAARQPRSAMLAALGAEIDALTEPVSVQRSWNIASDRSEPILLFESGEPAALAIQASESRGLLVLLAFPPELDCTDMPLRPLMVPFFQEVGRTGRALALGSSVVATGEIAQLGPAAASGVLRSMDPQRPTVMEIDAEGRTTQVMPFPGLWTLEQRDGRTRPIAARLDPQAASIERVEIPEIESWWAPVGAWSRLDAERPATDTTMRQDSAWTMPLLSLALLLLVTESLWSRRSSPRPTVGASA